MTGAVIKFIPNKELSYTWNFPTKPEFSKAYTQRFYIHVQFSTAWTAQLFESSLESKETRNNYMLLLKKYMDFVCREK
jgi:uncharacterized protein YndB with AHSA1/START domain